MVWSAATAHTKSTFFRGIFSFLQFFPGCVRTSFTQSDSLTAAKAEAAPFSGELLFHGHFQIDKTNLPLQVYMEGCIFICFSHAFFIYNRSIYILFVRTNSSSGSLQCRLYTGCRCCRHHHHLSHYTCMRHYIILKSRENKTG